MNEETIMTTLKLIEEVVPREREHFLKIFKIQVDDIILPWVADVVPMYWSVPMS